MLKSWLTLVIVLLIASQSVAAFSDAHQFYQADDAHVEFDHDHDHEGLDVDSTDKEMQQVEYSDDCDHCCHCHGSGEIFPEPLRIASASLFDQEPLDGYLFSFVVATPESIYHPPLV